MACASSDPTRARLYSCPKDLLSFGNSCELALQVSFHTINLTYGSALKGAMALQQRLPCILNACK